MSLDAATRGLGVALESTTIGGLHLAEGKLRPVFGLDKAISVKAHFAVYPARHSKRPSVDAFLSWLHGALGGVAHRSDARRATPMTGHRLLPTRGAPVPAGMDGRDICCQHS
jgi:hypothetical protein